MQRLLQCAPCAAGLMLAWPRDARQRVRQVQQQAVGTLLVWIHGLPHGQSDVASGALAVHLAPRHVAHQACEQGRQVAV